jgi:nucleoside-diphosphate-sugar epimerase
VLVTGGSGLLGRGIVHRLRIDGWQVRVLVHRSEIDSADEVCRGSLLDPAACAEAVAGCTAVVHAAGATHARTERAYRQTNVEGTRRLVAAARAAGTTRFLLVSSRTAGPGSGWYGATKLAAEQLLEGSGLAWTIVRLPEIYGAGGREGVEDIIARAKAGKTVFLPGRGETELCPMHVDDATTACANALGTEAAIHATYVLGGRCLTLRDFAKRCIHLAGSGSRIVSVPWPVVRVAAAAARFAPLPLTPDQPARLRAPKSRPPEMPPAELSVTVRPLDEGLRSVLATRE